MDTVFYTPPEVAKSLRVSSEKIIGWILAGELKAANIATRANGTKPRYRIAATDLQAFLSRRAGEAPPKPVRRRKQSAAGIKQYY